MFPGFNFWNHRFSAVPPGRATWAPGLRLAGLLLGLAVTVALGCGPGADAPSKDKPAAQAPATSPPASSSQPPGASLNEEVQALFNTLREAQLKKDLNLFLSCYASTFPGLAEKRQKTQAAWEQFTFTNMFYFLDEVTAPEPDQARVRVTWELQAQDRRTQEILTASQGFLVELKREGGKWRIAAVQETPIP